MAGQQQQQQHAAARRNNNNNNNNNKGGPSSAAASATTTRQQRADPLTSIQTLLAFAIVASFMALLSFHAGSVMGGTQQLQRMALQQQQDGGFLVLSSLRTAATTTTTTTGTVGGGDDGEDDPYALARDESYGFFDDIPATEWRRMKRRVARIHPNQCPYCRGGQRPAAWFQNHFEPEFNCRHERRIGRLGDGGKWICDPHRLMSSSSSGSSSSSSSSSDTPNNSTNQSPSSSTPPPPCLVYSVGSNNDYSFEYMVQQDIGRHCEIHTFDMANYSARAAEHGVHFHQWGLSDTNTRNARGRVFKTLNTTLHELGHVGRTIDIFKIDCEGCELSTYRSWVEQQQHDSTILRQILVEIHADKARIRPGTKEFFEGMKRAGYFITHKEPNLHYWGMGPAIEYAFLKLAPSFFVAPPPPPPPATTAAAS